MIKEKLNYLIKQSGQSQKDIAEKFGLLVQNMNRKIIKEALKPQELIKFAEATGCEIHFISKETKKTVVKFDLNDITEKEKDND